MLRLSMVSRTETLETRMTRHSIFSTSACGTLARREFREVSANLKHRKARATHTHVNINTKIKKMKMKNRKKNKNKNKRKMKKITDKR